MTGFVGAMEGLPHEEYLLPAGALHRQARPARGHVPPAGRGDQQRQIHANVDQFFRIERGEARFVFEVTGERFVHGGDGVLVPAGTYHNVINTSKTAESKLYTIYAPPNHPDGTVPQDQGGGGGGRGRARLSLGDRGDSA